LYVSSFHVPASPFTMPSSTRKAPGKARTEKGAVAAKSEHITFFTDFAVGTVANFARGNSAGLSNRPKDGVRDNSGSMTLRRHTDGIGDTLGFETAGNLNPYLGALRVVFQLAEGHSLPFIVFESTHIASWKGTPVGMRLMVDEKGCLRWQSLNGKVVSAVVSAPLPLAPATSIDIGCSWNNSTVALYHNGKEIGRQAENIVPPRIGRHFFIGSNCRAENTLEGRLERVKITDSAKHIGNELDQR